MRSGGDLDIVWNYFERWELGTAPSRYFSSQRRRSFDRVSRPGQYQVSGADDYWQSLRYGLDEALPPQDPHREEAQIAIFEIWQENDVVNVGTNRGWIGRTCVLSHPSWGAVVTNDWRRSDFWHAKPPAILPNSLNIIQHSIVPSWNGRMTWTKVATDSLHRVVIVGSGPCWALRRGGLTGPFTGHPHYSSKRTWFPVKSPFDQLGDNLEVCEHSDCMYPDKPVSMWMRICYIVIYIIIGARKVHGARI